MIYNSYTPQHPDRAEEWVESAENEPDIIERIIGGDLDAMIHNLDLCIREQAENEREEEDDQC